jgi:uncharacterized membrane protein
VPDTLPTRTRRLVWALACSQGALFAALGLSRWASFHNETFDLAFYTRIAWGLTHNDFWEPIVDAHFQGLHLSPVLVPLGHLGAHFGTAPVLIVAQAAALASAALPLSRIGMRHLGPAGAVAASLAWLLYPNVSQVAGYEVHPGSMAALPLAWMAWSIDRGHGQALLVSGLGVLACREDLALASVLGALVFAARYRGQWPVAALVAVGSLTWLLRFLLILHPRHAPEVGSLQLHFGSFGDTAGEVVAHLLTHPGELAAHLSIPERLAYLPKVLAPLLLLPLLRPSWLVPALPVLAVNLVSEWPTTTHLDVHYLTPALPFLVAGALAGAGRLRRAPVASWALALAAVGGHVVAGGSPLSAVHDPARFAPDGDTATARAIVAAIPPDASVQAPDALLPHLAERRLLRRAASAESGASYMVLDVWHRQRYAAREDLLRTTEEPPTRSWMARDDHRLWQGGGRYLLLERGPPPRTGVGGHAVVGTADPEAGQPIAACLAVLGARLENEVLTIELVARDVCPADLAIRLGTAWRARRVDLLFAGWLSPQHLRRGDRLESRHRLDAAEAGAIRARGLRVGALRSSGARPDPEDPTSVPVPLRPR